ncbi:xanthine dehydrogenase family protein molybdopterin-binding subunit [Devosia rhizoryzae]|uniref:Xanthine dehydrogenase family protein molybdopterin-binding subunit n=1 Tax=Devosia rhizoryzae TaxID=2774137 RepID=A0ABX7C7Q7_9HYPH|nr:molybdopterin cofactor-binding domain-containing protein [Devosia rhizoryzae]QQR39299.1 xanthine dehydrogenase family protein molybdopterin-binding subunit [Devosia rhizoryzae]
MNEIVKLNRRKFLISSAALGGAMVIGTKAMAASVDSQPWDKANASGSAEFTPWLTINADGSVVVRVTAVDIGQGTLTQVAGYVYEELSPAWDMIKPEYASTNRDFLENNVYSTPGGALAYFSGRSTGPARMDTYLQVAASARERLKAAAAAKWGVDAGEITVKDGVISHAGSSNSAQMGELIAEAAEIELEAEPAIKDQSEWTFLGKKAPAKVQLPKIVNGTLTYGIDVRPEGMVYAAIRQSPVMGGKLVSYDEAAIKDMPGVLAVVTVDPGENVPTDLTPPFPFGVSTAQHAVAVIAEHYWQARTALDALPIVWDDGPGAQWKTTEQMNEAAMAAVQQTGAKIETSVGDFEAVFADADDADMIEADYLTPYCEQAPLEPLNGTCLVTPDRVDFWHPSQHSQMAYMVAADETGVAPENVFFHQTFVGGGFGRRVFSDDARMVVAVAKKYPGKPVQVIWSREEATRQGRYRPLMAAKLKASLGADGMPTALLGRMSGGPGFFVSGMPDTALTGIMKNVQIESQTVPFHILTGPYRGPGYNSNAFFVETFIDECAVKAGIDPMEYRIKLYGQWPDVGWVKCLEEVKAKSGWGETLPKGQGRGVAIGNWGMGGKPDEGTTVATVAKVEVSQDGELKILQLDVAFDTGRIVNEDAVRTELEGGTMFGLNMSVNEGLNIEDGRIVEGNFDEYPMIRMADLPTQINVHFGGLTNAPRFFEIGEPPTGVVGPAVGNAIFQATGKRIRSTPFRLHDLSWS